MLTNVNNISKVLDVSTDYGFGLHHSSLRIGCKSVEIEINQERYEMPIQLFKDTCSMKRDMLDEHLKFA